MTSRGYPAGHRFHVTDWRDIPEGVPVRAVKRVGG